MQELILYYEILKRIISSKNKLFIFNFQKILILLLEIRLKNFIIYNLETNKQTKRKNQYLKHYLY